MKLSIISINYNDAKSLQKTIDSVVSQSWQDFEYIIIDGGSTDESINIIKKYKKNITYWVSEPDKGIYNAMNKGIAKANGEYLLMLNAGDVLSNSGVLAQVFQYNNYNEDLLYGDVYRESNGTIFRESIFPKELTFMFLRNGMISHQAVFIKKQLHSIIGLYDETIKYSADWCFLILAICKYNASSKHLNLKIAICNSDGLTYQPINLPSIKEERTTYLKLYFPAFVKDYSYFNAVQRTNIIYRTIFLFYQTKNKIKFILKYIVRNKISKHHIR